MRRAHGKHKQAGGSSVSAVMDALKATPPALPRVRAFFREIARDLTAQQTQFNEHMKQVEEEIVRGCRRTEGDIV